MEAAAAVGSIAALGPLPRGDPNADLPAAAAARLVTLYREAAHDPATGAPLPLDFSDLGEYFVRLSVLSAMSHARSPAGFSPEPVVDLLLSALHGMVNRSKEYDSTGALPRF